MCVDTVLIRGRGLCATAFDTPIDAFDPQLPQGQLQLREANAQNRLRSKGEPQRKLDLPVSPLSGGNRARAADPSRRIG